MNPMTVALCLAFILPAVSAKIPLVDLSRAFNVTLRYIEGTVLANSSFDESIAIFRTDSRLWLYTADYLSDLICKADVFETDSEEFGYVAALHRRLSEMFKNKDASISGEEARSMKDLYEQVMFPLYELRQALLELGGPISKRPIASDVFADSCRKFGHMQLYTNANRLLKWDCQQGDYGGSKCQLNGGKASNSTDYLTKSANIFLSQLGELQVLTTFCAMCNNDETVAKKLYEEYHDKIMEIVQFMYDTAKRT